MKLKGGQHALLLLFFINACSIASPVSRRDLGGIVGGLLDPNVHEPTTTPVSNVIKQGHGLSTAASTSYVANESTRSHESAESHATSSITETLRESIPTATFTADLGSISPTSTTSSSMPISSTAGHSGYAQDASHMPPGEATEWKVIGITVLSITIVGGIMLGILFSDTLTKLFKDVCLGGNRKRLKCGEENLVPDWQTRSWEYILADEEGHRYPTVSASLQSMVERVQGAGQFTQVTGKSPMVAPPAASYLPELDPHPLDPLLRRPSCKHLN
ncbi:hypothetical protein AX15_000631 [Amanita polypyramis BW_CC]|nr:hypothetical protein AX15_000631 [Amanita polypyramis BW_CC]